MSVKGGGGSWAGLWAVTESCIQLLLNKTKILQETEAVESPSHTHTEIFASVGSPFRGD